jgi:hypothetical protein
MKDNINIYNPAHPKKKTAFNSQLSFEDTAIEVTRDARKRACDRLTIIIANAKRTLTEQE